jgi:DNA polymerase III delta subunit
MLAPVADLKPVYLIGGSDRPKVVRAVRRLRERVGQANVEILSAIDVSADAAVASCNALGLFTGEARLVLVEDVDGRPNADGRRVGGWKAADAKTIADYVANPAPATVLALVSAEVKKDAPLTKACAKAGDVLAYDAPKNLASWVMKQFAANGIEIEASAADVLVELVGDDATALGTEVDKLAIWSGGERVTERDVHALSPAVAETAPFELTDAWGRRDVVAVLRASELILERSDQPRRDVVPRLLGILAAHVDRVRRCKRFDAEGVSPREAATRLKRHPFYVQKLFAQAQNFSVEELRSAVVRLAELDHAVKGGSRLSGELELARALIDVTRPAEAPAVAG